MTLPTPAAIPSPPAGTPPADPWQLLAEEQRRHQETSALLSMLVHEVRNPLALVQVAARNIASGRTPPGAPQAAALGRIDQAVRDISALLERCVETDLLEHGALMAQHQPVDAAACLRDWLARHPARDRIQATLPERLVADLDADLWLAMVRNLVDNALKYAPAGAPVQLLLQVDALQLWVEVRNPVGPAGRPDPTRLFSKHYRADTVAGIPGTGLGLYWVHQLCGRLGGTAQHLPAAERADAPVVFRLSLPR